jgi:hypothetical protein
MDGDGIGATDGTCARRRNLHCWWRAGIAVRGVPQPIQNLPNDWLIVPHFRQTTLGTGADM